MKKNKFPFFISVLYGFILFVFILNSCGSELRASEPAVKKGDLIQKDKEQIWLYLNDIGPLSDISSWKNTHGSTDVVVISIASVKNLDPAQIRKINEIRKASEIKIAVECSGLVSSFGSDSFHNTQKSIAYNSVNHPQKGEYTYLSSLIENGCEINYLIFKNSISNAIYPNASHKTPDNRFMTTAEAISQTVEAMKIWREYLPDVRFLLTVDFYNYGWKGETAYNLIGGSTVGAGDYFLEMSMIADTADDTGIPLWGLIVNNPYDYALGRHGGETVTTDSPGSIDWMSRVYDLEKECDLRGMNFILTLNSDLTGRNGSDEKYYNDLIRFINRYSESGGNPRAYLIRGGVSFPSALLPETKPFTLTYDALKIISYFKFGEDLTLSLTSKKTVSVPDNIELIREWNFDDKTGGWSEANQISDFKTENGYLSVVSSGSDPHFLTADALDIHTDDCAFLYIKYINISSVSDRMEFFFSTYESPGMDEIKTIKFSVDPMSEDDVWSELYLPLNQCDAWQGTLQKMRIDPGMTSGEFRFDRIALYRQE